MGDWESYVKSVEHQARENYNEEKWKQYKENYTTSLYYQLGIYGEQS